MQAKPRILANSKYIAIYTLYKYTGTFKSINNTSHQYMKYVLGELQKGKERKERIEG